VGRELALESRQLLAESRLKVREAIVGPGEEP
jgi:hypothetical protein